MAPAVWNTDIKTVKKSTEMRAESANLFIIMLSKLPN